MSYKRCFGRFAGHNVDRRLWEMLSFAKSCSDDKVAPKSAVDRTGEAIEI
jgi:hypothetical protein